MMIEIDGKRIKVEGDVIVRYKDGNTEMFIAEKVDMLYLNKAEIQSFNCSPKSNK